ncbi:MAG: hypothetical protein HY928_09810 [Elusimicrobia bacterium]|nr:hypothetical protein [Elusimicrobiota bacterium]
MAHRATLISAFLLLSPLPGTAGPVSLAPVLPGVLAPLAVPAVAPAPAPAFAPRLPAAFFPGAPALAPVLPAVAIPALAAQGVPAPKAAPAAFEVLAQASQQLAAPKGSAPQAVLSELFEGSSALAASVDAPQASFLAPAGRADAPRLAAVVAEARRSKTGRRVLKKAERLLAKKPLRVEVHDLKGDYGAYDYWEDVLILDRSHLADTGMSAATLVHELLHVLQHQMDVPAEALEMELEAHLVTFDVMRELGVPVPKGGFSEAALAALHKGPKAYADWMAGQLPGKTRLAHSSLAEVRSLLEYEVEELADEADSAPESRRKKALLRLAWAQRDLALVRSKKGAASYRAFTKRVLALIARRSRGTE